MPEIAVVVYVTDNYLVFMRSRLAIPPGLLRMSPGAGSESDGHLVAAFRRDQIVRVEQGRSMWMPLVRRRTYVKVRVREVHRGRASYNIMEQRLRLTVWDKGELFDYLRSWASAWPPDVTLGIA